MPFAQCNTFPDMRACRLANHFTGPKVVSVNGLTGSTIDLGVTGKVSA
jgi:hypothetical protein